MSSAKIQDLRTFRVPATFRGRSPLLVQIWWLVQATLFRMSPQFLYGWRRWLLRLFGANVGKGVLVRPTVEITFPWKIELGDNCWIGDHVTLYSLGPISIGHDAVVSQKSYICTGSHDFRSPSFDILALPVTIEPMAWVATDVFVAPGVTIGEGAVVSARSSVFGNLPANMICRGNPAVPVKARCNESVAVDQEAQGAFA